MSDYNKLIQIVTALKAKNHAEKQQVVATINIIMGESISHSDVFSLIDEQIEKMSVLNNKENVLNDLLKSITQEEEDKNDSHS